MEAVMSNVPKLRFKEFHGNWEQHQLGDVGKVSMCKRIFKEQTSSGAEIPFYKIGTFGKSPDAYIEKSLYEEFKAKYSYPKVGDILISASGTIGRTVEFDGAPSYFQDSNIVWLANDESLVTNRFLLHVYENTRWTTEDTTIARLYNDNLKRITFSTPPIIEQQKIADFLTAVDTKIEQLTRKEELLTQYKKGVMQKIFSQEIRFKADDGSEFPEWEELDGNELFAPVSNKNHNSDLPILAITQEHGAIPRDMIDYQISVTEQSVAAYKVVDEGDFIISLRSFQGGIEYSEYKGICSPAYIILRKTRALDDLFYKAFFKTERYIKLMNTKIEGIRDGKMISYKQFSEVELPTPCIEEQNKIASFFVALDQKILKATTQLDAAKIFKKGLLQQMFV